MYEINVLFYFSYITHILRVYAWPTFTQWSGYKYNFNDFQNVKFILSDYTDIIGLKTYTAIIK